jgi:hypothetical protein
MQAANDRYLAFMAGLDSADASQNELAMMAAPAKLSGHPCSGLAMFFDTECFAQASLIRAALGH